MTGIIPMIDVYGYIRVSTETQADKGYGLETQENAIREYCTANNLNLIGIYADEGISGTIGDKDNLSSRPALCEMLDTLNGTNTIIVMNTSRLWRDDTARALIVMNVKKRGGEIISVEQPRYSLYSTNPSDALFNTLMEALDQYERMTINQRLTKGKTTKAKNGYKPTGMAPFGYCWVNAKIVIDPIESKIVKEIFDLAYNGKNCHMIANLLNSQNKLTRRNNQWSRQQIGNILKNKFYAGILSHKKEEIDGKHDPLINIIVWEVINRRNTI